MLIPNLGMGGAQRVFQEHSQLLAERYRVVDIAFNLDGGERFPTGNPLLTLDVAGGGGAMDKTLNLSRRVAAMRRIKRESGARLCISHMPGADYVNLLSKGVERAIAVVHGSKQGDRNFAGLTGLLQNRLLQPLLYRRADGVVTVSQGIERELTALGVGRHRLVTINNFFDPDAIRSAAAEPLTRQEQSLFDGTPVLATCGRLHPQKNQAALLDVLAQLKHKRRARLLIIGDGELRGELVERAARLGLSTWAAWRDQALTPGHDLYLLGAQTNPFRWLARADLFVLPSAWEGFPLALCEAIICGLPVVSTDCPTGPREILAPESDGLVPWTNVTEPAPYGYLMPQIATAQDDAGVPQWVQALDHLLGDAGERQALAEAGQRRMEDFTRARIGGQWLDLVAGVLDGAGTSRR